jgi:hypothetical protein
MRKIPGAWSHVLGRFLEIALLGAQGLQTAGVPIMIFGECYILKARLKVLITDGDGLRPPVARGVVAEAVLSARQRAHAGERPRTSEARLRRD